MSEEGSNGVYVVLDSGDQDLIDEVMGLSPNQIAGRILAMDPEWRKKNYKQLKETRDNPEWRRNHSIAMKKKSMEYEIRKKHSVNMKNLNNNSEFVRKKISCIKELTSNPEWRRKNAEKNKKLSQDPEWRRKNAEIQRNRRKPIICVETGVIYDGFNECHRITGLDDGAINAVCKGRRQTHAGYHWRYATPEEITKFRQDQKKDKS